MKGIKHYCNMRALGERNVAIFSVFQVINFLVCKKDKVSQRITENFAGSLAQCSLIENTETIKFEIFASIAVALRSVYLQKLFSRFVIILHFLFFLEAQ